MHTTTIRSAQPVGILRDGTPSRWRTRLPSILRSRSHRKSEGSKYDSLRRIDERLLADVGLYRGQRIHNPQNRTDQQRGSPVPVVLLAMWAPL